MLRVQSAPCLRSPRLCTPAGRRPFLDDHSIISRDRRGHHTKPRAAAVASVLLLQLGPQLQDVGRSIEHELVIESTLHVSAMQRLGCVQRLAAEVHREPGLLATDNAQDCDGALDLLPFVEGGKDGATSVRREAAMCYATPPDSVGDDEEEEPSFRLNARAAAPAPAERLALYRSAMSRPAVGVLQRQASATLELLASEASSQAAQDWVRQRRRCRRYAVRAMRGLRSLSSSAGSVSLPGLLGGLLSI